MVHEFMLISICQCLCHIMKVSLSHSFNVVNGFIVSCVSWCQWFHGVIGFAVSMVSWCHRFRGVNGFMVS